MRNFIERYLSHPATPVVLLVALLATLHGALVAGSGSGYQKAWFFAHLGVFLLWQPFLSPTRELRLRAALLVVVLSLIGSFLFSGLVLVCWTALLVALFGGRVLANVTRDWLYLAALLYVLAALLGWVVPYELLRLKDAPPEVLLVGMQLIVPLYFAVMLITGWVGHKERATASDGMPSGSAIFDFFYAVVVFQLVLLIVFGSVTVMSRGDEAYFPAVVKTTIAVGVSLLCLALLWNPGRLLPSAASFVGLRTYFSKYLLTIGLPFELWMRQIAHAAQQDDNANSFLNQAMRELGALDWIVGARWGTHDGATQEFGFVSSHATEIVEPANVDRTLQVTSTIYTRIGLSPAMQLHVRLLAQVIAQFYVSRRREERLQQMSYVQAVHETGARVTHDVKNLLQSIRTLTQAMPSTNASSAQDQRGQAYLQLLRNHLPTLADRLEQTIVQLARPEDKPVTVRQNARDWWLHIQTQAFPTVIHWQTGDEMANDTSEIDSLLFTMAIEHCASNVQRLTQLLGSPIRMTVHLINSSAMDICNDGPAIPDDMVAQLFKQPISLARSGTQQMRSSYGLGLYQLSQFAHERGYSIKLASNQPSHVAFSLRASD
jgi:hypothetical protein